jgi:hypothetical protein
MGDSSMGGKIKRLACLDVESWGRLSQSHAGSRHGKPMSRSLTTVGLGARHWQQREKGMVNE